MFRLPSKQLIQITATLLLLVAGDVGDFVQSRPHVMSYRKFHAILDNFIHVIIGLLSWTVVDPNSIMTCSPEFILVGIGASVIDLDHFLAARSFSPDAAMHAPYRGILHCSGILLVLALLLGYFNRTKWMLILLVSFIPHHLRDSTRRGIYISPPYIHSNPLPMSAVRLLLVIFPWVIWLIRTRIIEQSTPMKPLTSFTV